MSDRVNIWRSNALGLWLDDCPPWDHAKADKRNHAGLYRSLGDVVRILRQRGWWVRRDPHTVKHHGCISFEHRLGIGREQLQATIELSGRHLGLEFFQNRQNIDHPNGGRYEFGKFRRMTYLQQLEARLLTERIACQLAERNRCPIVRTYQTLGIPRSLYLRRSFEEWWRQKCAEDTWWYKPELGRAEYTGGKQSQGSADGELLAHGATGWALENGRWVRGKLYYSLNNSWLLRLSPHRVLWRASYEIRARPPRQLRGRQVPEKASRGRVLALFNQARKSERFDQAARFAAMLAEAA